MIDDFSKNGYYLKKTIFSKSLIDLYESEFDKIVHQLKKSREDINARWGSQLTSNIETDNHLTEAQLAPYLPWSLVSIRYLDYFL